MRGEVCLEETAVELTELCRDLLSLLNQLHWFISSSVCMFAHALVNTNYYFL